MSNIQIKIMDVENKSFYLDLPKFVADTTYFEKKVQVAYDGLKLAEFTSDYDSRKTKLEKTLKKNSLTIEDVKAMTELPADVSRDYAAYTKAKSSLQNFHSVLKARYDKGIIPQVEDNTVIAYTWAMTASRLELPMPGMKVFMSNCITYGNQFIGSENWNANRKTAFKKLKDSAIEILNVVFDFTNGDGLIYKKVSAKNFSSKNCETVVNSIYGKYTVNKTGGVEITHLKERGATQQLILSFLEYQGCDTKKKSTGNGFTAWNL